MNTLIQVLAGFLTCLLFYVSVIIHIYPKKRNVAPSKFANPKKHIVDVVRGAVPLNSRDIVINTDNPQKGSFLRLPRSTSYDQGGFAYSFWINSKSSQASRLKSMPLILRGVDTKAKLDGGTDEIVAVKMPYIRFSDDANDLTFVVEYNTTVTPHQEWVVDYGAKSTLHGDKWYMVTFVFHDYVSEYGVKRGYRIDMYIDDRLMSSKVEDGVGLIMNNGPIIVLPSTTPISEHAGVTGFISDIRYLNFAPSALELYDLFKRGYSRDNYVTPKTIQTERTYNNYEIMSLYNELR